MLQLAELAVGVVADDVLLGGNQLFRQCALQFWQAAACQQGGIG
jgi:hypothetical protein